MDPRHSDFILVKTRKDLLDLVEWRNYTLKIQEEECQLKGRMMLIQRRDKKI